MELPKPLTVEFYVRADAPIQGRREELLERIRRLERQTRIAELRVHPWPHAISVSLANRFSYENGKTLLGLFRSFETWADDHGLDIRPPFDVRTTHSTITEETDEVLTLPVFCIAAYNEGTLVAMAPCRDGDSVLSVADAVDALIAGTLPRPKPTVEA